MSDVDQRLVAVRPTSRTDARWVLRSSWSRELIGRQYHWAEVPLQAVIAPLRALGLPRGPSYVIEVDGQRAGYIGRNPLSGNLEYWIEPWARGGVGQRAISAFLLLWRESPDSRDRAFSIARRNERSLAALRGALGRIGWSEPDDYVEAQTRHGWKVVVRHGVRT